MSTCTPLSTAELAGGRPSSDDRTEGPRALLRRWYGPLFDARTWKETAALVLALPTGIVWFTVFVTGLSVSAGLMITVVGLPLLLVVLRGGRVVAAVECATARALLDLEVGEVPPLRTHGTFWARVRQSLSDGPSWKGVAYGLAALPIGVVTFTSAVVLWSVAAAMTAFPVYQTWTSDSGDVPDALSPFVHGWGRVGSVVTVGLVGLASLGLVPRLVHGLARVQRGIVSRWLSTASRGVA